jgi:hypothetical protein
MLFRERWDEFAATHTGGNWTATIEYALRWADLMEAEMNAGSTLESVAKATSFAAIQGEVILGSMYGDAVNLLVATWEYGEQLGRWDALDLKAKNPYPNYSINIGFAAPPKGSSIA